MHSTAPAHFNLKSSQISSSFQQQTTHSNNASQKRPQNIKRSSANGYFRTRQQKESIERPRYVAITPLKLAEFTEAMHGNTDKSTERNNEYRPERKSPSREKSSDKPGRLHTDSSDYYKYWKKKATEYQQLNFQLHHLNSSLQQQNQILKHRIQKLQQKLSKATSQSDQPLPAVPNYQKLEHYYKQKLQQMSRQISQQESLIAKQSRKIKQLSNYISENYHLKHIIDNMEQKFTEMHSNAGSREDSFSKHSDKSIKAKNQFLSVEYIKEPKFSSISRYGVKGRGYQDDSRSSRGH